MTALPDCPICGQPIIGHNYRCAALDRGTWRTIVIHKDCWQRRHELKTSPQIEVVQEPVDPWAKRPVCQEAA